MKNSIPLADPPRPARQKPARRLFTGRFLILLPALTLALHAFGQPALNPEPPGRRLQIGDTVPAFTLQVLRNPAGAAWRRDDLAGRLLILDFWNTHCLSCIEAIPRLERLQQQFGDSIRVVMVTRDAPDEVARLVQRIGLLRQSTLPLVAGDTLLSAWFPFTTFPSHVWISPRGVVLAITEADNTHEASIRRYFRTGEASLSLKQEDPAFEYGASLLQEGHGRQLKYLRLYSYFMKGVEGVNGQGDLGFEKDPRSGRVRRIYITGMPIQFLIQIAYAQNDPARDFLFDPKRNVLEVSDPDRFRYPADRSRLAAWRDRNIYSYEACNRDTCPVDLFRRMRQDLLDYFGLQASIRLRQTVCLLLCPDSLCTPQPGAVPAGPHRTMNLTRFLNMANALAPLPVVTNLPAGVAATVVDDPATGNGDLFGSVQASGWKLVPVRRDLPMLVISDRRVEGTTPDPTGQSYQARVP